MSTALSTPDRDGYTPDQIALVKRTVCVGATDDELTLFLGIARRAGLDPFAKQIYAIKRKGKMCIQVGIDGYRLIADRTGKYAGNDDPVFDNEDKPTRATVTVYKLVGGLRCPFTATARLSQYRPEDGGFMWQRMPHLMLGKCAEGLALRKAFPAELSGLYTEEEMEQAGEPDKAPVRQLEAPAPKPAPVSPPSDDPLAKELAAEVERTGTRWTQCAAWLDQTFPNLGYKVTTPYRSIPTEHVAALVQWLKGLPAAQKEKVTA